MKIAFIGKSGAGKSCLFELITKNSDYRELPQGGKLAAISVPDERLNALVSALKPKRCRSVEAQIVDPGPGLRLNSPNIADSDILVVISKGSALDIKEVIDKIFARDEEIVDKKLMTLEQEMKKRHGQEDLEVEFTVFKKVKQLLSHRNFLSSADFSSQGIKIIHNIQPLSLKKIYVVINQEAKEMSNEVVNFLKEMGLQYQVFSVSLHYEIAQLPPREQELYYQEYNLDEKQVENLLKSIYSASGYITFYTVVNEEVRAWPLRKGEDILTAAGKIHTDMARGFIRAEVISFDDFSQCDFSLPQAREKGILRLESKEYIVQDGDVVYIRFKV